MRAIILALLLLPNSTFAFLPESPGDSPITKIVGEDLRCEDHGVLFALRTAEHDEKVWQSDPGMNDGLEVTIKKFDRYECPYNFNIEAEVVAFGMTAPLNLKVSTPVSEGGCVDQPIQLEAYIDGKLAKTVPCKRQ